MTLHPEYDVVVIGAGPAGSTTARFAADAGLNVLLVDKRQELGAPIQCSGAVSAHALGDVGIAAAGEMVSTTIFGFEVYDSHGHQTTLDYRKLRPEDHKEHPLGYVVDRRRFDRFLTTLAERAGVQVSLKTEASGYSRADDGRVEVTLAPFGREETVSCRVLVGADGIQSQVGKWAGLRTHIKLTELASCLQYVVDGVEATELLEIFTGFDLAPGGYAWIFPKGHGYAEVGLGVIRTMTDRDARWHLDHFIKNELLSDRLHNYRVLEVQGGGVPLAAPLKKQYEDNIILVGDAARHVNPITGGGIHTAIKSGQIAGEFLGELLKAGETPLAQNLEEYQNRWHREMGALMWKLYRIKSDIFKLERGESDARLYQTMSAYFAPDSPYRKI